MSNLQNDLNKLQGTIEGLAEAINEISIASGNGEVISECTKFSEYPDILRSVVSTSGGGIATVFAYRISDVNPGIPEDEGSFDFATNTYTAPTNWSKANELNALDQDTVWMIQGMFAKSSNARSSNGIMIDSWSRPVRIANFSGTVSSEKIKDVVYYSSKEEIVPNKPVGTDSGALNVESISMGWSEIYTGITEDKPFVWVSTRTKSNNTWSIYSTPVLYAKYGKDGENGGDGLVSRTAFAFKATKSREDYPDRPQGGKWDINTNNIILPDGWYDNPNTDDVNRYSWMSTAVFSTDRPSNPEWEIPVCITGEDGVDGTDGVSSEFIYARLLSQDDTNIFKSHIDSKNISLEVSQTDTVPNFISNGQFIGTGISIPRGDGSIFRVQLTDSPIGIDDENKVEIYWTRTKNTTGWGNWIGPMYWSVWGENGMDGDGIEYIFTASNDASCDTPLPTYADLLLNNPAEAKRFQEREYVPEGWFDNEENSDENGNWKGCGPDAPYLFCSSRKQYTNDEGIQMWGDFSTPKIWGHWGKDGSGSYTSFAFCISKEDLSNYTVTGGYYGDSLLSLVTRNENGVEVELKWHDTIPRAPMFDESIWMINKFFNGSSGEEGIEWAGPTKMADSEHFQVEFNCPIEGDSMSIYDGRPLISLQSFKELKEKENVIFNSNDDLETAWRKYVYNNGYGSWNDGGSGAVYMATARFINNKWEEWSVNKIQGEAGDTTQFVFKLSNGYTKPDNPTPANTKNEFQSDKYKPDGWNNEPQSVSESFPVCWVSQRDRKSGVWQKYSDPTQWSMYAKGNVHLELSEDQVNIPCEPDGNVDEDYNDFIIVSLMLYDNGVKVSGDYSALINDDIDDFKITSKLTSEPSSPSVCGFLGDKLYIGREFLSRYVRDYQLKVECRAMYSATGDHANGIPYVKSFTIVKSTNTYELAPSHNVLHSDKDGKFKDKVMTVQVIKWREDVFQVETGGYIEYILNFNDGTAQSYGSNVDPGGIEYIYLEGYVNVASITINFRLKSDSEILSTETIGVVMDANDAVTKFLSQVFCRTNTNIGNSSFRPTGGTFDNPIPSKGGVTWTDGIPSYNANSPQQIWMSQKWFSSDDPYGLYTYWSIPTLLQDTNEVDIWWCDEDGKAADVGTPTSKPSIWYDGDDVSGNNITNDPIWMAVQHLSGGKKSDWIVTRVKGEKGDPGPVGPEGPPGKNGVDGTNGGFGPMVRYSVWGSTAPGSYYYDRDTADAEEYRWYDMVECGGDYYLCQVKHAVSTSPKPGSGSGWTTYWVKSSHFDFLTANDAAIKNFVAERIQADKVVADQLQTRSDTGPWINIQNGVIQVYKDQLLETCPSIVFGLDENNLPRIEFWKDCNTLAYSIGPGSGYQDYTKTEYDGWGTPNKLYTLPSLNYSNAQQTIPTLIESLMNDYTWGGYKNIIQKVHTINGEPTGNNGKYYTEAIENDIYLATGTFGTYKQGHGFIDDLKDESILDQLNAFKSKYPAVSVYTSGSGQLCSSTIQVYQSGVIVFTEKVFWIKAI